MLSPIFSVLSLCFQKFLFLSDDSQKRNYSNYQHSPKSNCKLILRRIFMPDRRCNFSHKYRRNQSSYSTNNRKYTTGSGVGAGVTFTKFFLMLYSFKIEPSRTISRSDLYFFSSIFFFSFLRKFVVLYLHCIYCVIWKFVKISGEIFEKYAKKKSPQVLRTLLIFLIY